MYLFGTRNDPFFTFFFMSFCGEDLGRNPLMKLKTFMFTKRNTFKEKGGFPFVGPPRPNFTRSKGLLRVSKSGQRDGS